jgi:hypothetical protein
MSQSLKSCIKQLEEQLAEKHSSLQSAYVNLKSDVYQKMTSPKSLALAFFSGFSLMYFNKQKSQQSADPKKMPLLPALTHASNFILLGERLKRLLSF